MENEPQRDPLLREALEACRFGHDDLSAPELAFLAERLESDRALAEEFRHLRRLDQSLADAFRDVPVPEGLAERILARLDAEVEAPNAQGETSTEAPLAGAASPSRRFSRRWLVVGAGSIVAAVAMLILAGTQIARPLPFDGSDVAQMAIEFYGAESADDGQTVEDAAPPASYPFAAEVQATRGMKWRWVSGFLGRTAVAYDVTGPHGECGTLYVVLGTAENVAAAPAAQPFVTQGCAASAWQTDSRLYVFVVKGGRQSYERLLVAPREPLA